MYPSCYLCGFSSSNIGTCQYLHLCFLSIFLLTFFSNRDSNARFNDFSHWTLLWLHSVIHYSGRKMNQNCESFNDNQVTETLFQLFYWVRVKVYLTQRLFTLAMFESFLLMLCSTSTLTLKKSTMIKLFSFVSICFQQISTRRTSIFNQAEM